MATDWTAEALSAYEDIKAEGFAIKVRVDGSDGVWNDTTMVYTGAVADTDYSTYGLKGSYSIKDIDGTVVQQGDIKLFFPAYGLPEVTTANKILIGTDIYTIVNVKPVDPGNVALMYEAQCRE